MGQSVTISPSLSVLLPLFLERCAAIRSKLEQIPANELSGELLEKLRLSYLAPLNSPSRAELGEELYLITTPASLLTSSLRAGE